MARILIVDDELCIIEVLRTLLRKGGHTVVSATCAKEALKLLREDVFDLMITDIRLPGMDGIALLAEARELQSQMAIITMTAYADVENAVAAMRNGAFDYITKPFKFEELILTVDRALSYETALAENKVLKTTLHAQCHFNFIVGDSTPMLELYRLIEKISRTNSTVLILGESGTGKELVAQAVHNSSPRSSAPFVKVNCTAMPETLLESELFGYVKGAFTGAGANKKGLFETAHGGTIFLDEIGSIPLNMQMKLLRVLQEKKIRRVGGTEDLPVDIRIIAATNEDLERKISRGEFRDDLYFRLSVIPLRVPALRERCEDVPLLVSHFLTQFERDNKSRITISADTVKALCSFDWPGNIRQLENTIKRMATLNETGNIEISELPVEIGPAAQGNGYNMSRTNGTTAPMPQSASRQTPDIETILPLKQYLKTIEEKYIKDIIGIYRGDKDAAAKRLDISLATLYRKIGNEEN